MELNKNQIQNLLLNYELNIINSTKTNNINVKNDLFKLNNQIKLLILNNVKNESWF
jgi:hypothetical protein